MTAVLTQNGTLSVPLDQGLTLIAQSLGPFGTVTMRRVAYPKSLVSWHREASGGLLSRLGTANESVSEAYDIAGSSISLASVPATWHATAYLGGDLTCPLQALDVGTGIFFSNEGVCVGHKEDVIMANELIVSEALLAVGFTLDISGTCAHSSMGMAAACENLLRQSHKLVKTAYTTADLIAAAAMAEGPQHDIQTTVPVALTQFVQNSSGTFFVHTNVLNPADPTFHVYGWLYLIEWLQGVREVVEFAGKKSAITALSSRNAVHVGPVNPLEVPVNVAYFGRSVLLYVSSILLLVACLACTYIVATKGCIEGFNMFSINRVTGLVWIGRPLLVLRGTTAICLLSTAKLDLAENNGFYHFISEPQSWFTTIMATGEVSWLVYILNDTFSIITKQHTAIYADASSILMWVASAVWSLLVPVQHRITVARSCTVVSVDNQIVCRSGIVAIGNFQRFCGLFTLATTLVPLTYLVQRCRFPLLADTGLRTNWLYATAYHHYKQDGWVYNNVYHIDRASAAFNGLLSMPWGKADTVVLDIKTWRLFVRSAVCLDMTTPPHLAHTIPLI
ncbi:hypothetical protein ACHHYP_05439 [Achlya hypogyna]|uniref:Transmembrane protein n=1 Tax=Achlya hypogyna TaxID=1202772 RepID=A0A1V9YXJ5_ACHHY|nr:hypothetical protein ACHHYP_05439 [Achlya hypogyna]